MQQAARRIAHEEPRGRGGRMRAVPSTRARQHARAGARATDARCRAVFTTAMTLLVALCVLGTARVAVIARAAELAVSEGTLTERIRAQRIEADRLEIDRSSLSTPSRIEEIATATMGMGRPASVRYITLGAGGAVTDAAAVSGSAPAPASDGQTAVAGPARSGARTAAADMLGRVGAVIGTLVDMSTGEAQALLVGDVGLSGSR